jgi:predicted nuclease of predicted toxin-antitoxin system
MSVIADESVDFGIISGLRKHTVHVFSVAENCGGISDIEVLKIAVKNSWILITEDKDFGELAFRLKFDHKGILLIRLNDLPREERLILAVATINQNLHRLNGNFAVLSKKGLRIKNLTGKEI